MKSIPDALKPILIRPTPAALVDLQVALLASGASGEALEQALELAGQFHAYLGELESKATAQEFSELASRLDMGAVGAVALENLASTEQRQLWQRLLLGGLSEVLMVAASRQYVKTWVAESGLVHSRAAWTLAQALWRVSSRVQPEQPAEARWQEIQALLAPAHDAKTPGAAKALLLGRVFQVLLVALVRRLLESESAS